MSLLYSPEIFGKESKQKAVKELLANTVDDVDYYVMLIGALLLAIGAIFTDNVSMVLASTIIAPLAYPILTLGLGIISGSLRLIGRSLAILGISCVLALALSMLISALFGNVRVSNNLISFTENHWVTMSIAVVAGVIASYAFIRPRVASVVTGVAVAISLMPPLAAVGVGFATKDNAMAIDALTMFLLNVLGILIASIVVFRIFHMGKAYRHLETENNQPQ